MRGRVAAIADAAGIGLYCKLHPGYIRTLQRRQLFQAATATMFAAVAAPRALARIA
jgi:hypothetical protein